ncbi:hypothetical protein BASA50_003669 [Batrachochytrium salamandrivorans]|uniref:RING-type domain-containing protein n=1 Tax=Batrachochytrium salamandrivorans TaxID=1357716 RepID=A0ABQ8FI45_9FUNG|nr:hypothetical protein BASA62_007222 [Batrachochytrium salamandrivorans]KAH6579240.1 hypothetical protein BASA60_003359 [Batrachochytrium salamandrivorans]KAH6598633.1 hypothetical protein BASA50_003669 [Batrachochytrium salamandrivorans]KAH6600808.1 hypothetical protein BASA61_002227 [Batrachochytrium salamandrivorans]KAH9276288.1 hypothetical protein BASA83_000967 [Batrachochytrium salamandrivorans]
MSTRAAPKSKKAPSTRPAARKDDRLVKLKGNQERWMAEMDSEREGTLTYPSYKPDGSVVVANLTESTSSFANQAGLACMPVNTVTSQELDCSSDLLVRNWCQLPNRVISTASKLSPPMYYDIDQPQLPLATRSCKTPHEPLLAGNQVNDRLACPICSQMINLPVLAIPCGHSFCRECLVTHIKNAQERFYAALCKCCNTPIQGHVPNLTLQQALNSLTYSEDQHSNSFLPQYLTSPNDDCPSKSNPISHNQVERSETASTIFLDFDQDPSDIALVYKTQYQQLDQRCRLIEEEASLLKNERIEKQTLLETTKAMIISHTIKVQETEALIEENQAKLKELCINLLSSKERAIQLDDALKSLTERELLATTAVNTISKRRDKVRIVFEGIQKSLNDEE